MQDRQPLIDPQTFEILYEVYQIVAQADSKKGGGINPGDISYISGQLKSLLILNSAPAIDPRTDTKVASRIKELGRKFLP